MGDLYFGFEMCSDLSLHEVSEMCLIVDLVASMKVYLALNVGKTLYIYSITKIGMIWDIYLHIGSETRVDDVNLDVNLDVK